MIYRLVLDNTGFQRLQSGEYEMVVAVREGNDVKGWKKLSFTWNEAIDNAYSQYSGEWPDYFTVGFKVPMDSGVTEYHLKEGDVPSYDGVTFRPGYVFLGWEADGVVYNPLPAVTKDVTYTAAYRSSDAGDVNGDGKIIVKDAARVLLHLENSQIPVPVDAADIDGSGKVEIADVTAMLQMIVKGAVPGDPTVAALQGKTALFCGDSITEALDIRDSRHPSWGWGGRIGTFYNMKSFVNQGRGNATVSNFRPANRIIDQVNAHYGKSYDYVILHGSTNDAGQSVAVGSMTAADCFDPMQFDPSTFAGGLEELFYTAKNYFPDAGIGYIINFRYNPAMNHGGNMGDMSGYVEVSKKICDKWGIPYLDLYNMDGLYETLMPGTSTRYIIDGVHPNSNGYDLLYPYVAEFMASIK